jgi:hypothetical protein
MLDRRSRGADRGAHSSGKRHKRRDVAVEGAHGKAAVAQKARMSSAAGRQAQHRAARPDQRQESDEPDVKAVQRTQKF